MEIINEKLYCWATDLEDSALQQSLKLSNMPLIFKHIALMPDAHAGNGSTVGTVFASQTCIIPSTVGVDIGCGMMAKKIHLKVQDLENIGFKKIRNSIERNIPMGMGGAFGGSIDIKYQLISDEARGNLGKNITRLIEENNLYPTLAERVNFCSKAIYQLGTLGSGNHFIEICHDKNDFIWVLLHSGSRAFGNVIGNFFIREAHEYCARHEIEVPDNNLGYIHKENRDLFKAYWRSMEMAQDYAYLNRELLMNNVLFTLDRLRHPGISEWSAEARINKWGDLTKSAVNCHHNYACVETHFDEQVFVTRKGAVNAEKDRLGIIPQSMGRPSFIVRGKGNPLSFNSCSHGAGRKMGRNEAKRKFTLEDFKEQTKNVECSKTEKLIDEIPGAYKDMDEVMRNQEDLVEIHETLYPLICMKGY